MNQQELFERLKRAMDIIKQNPRTSAEVAGIFREFVESMEEIVDDLATTSDEQIAETLRELVTISSMEMG